MKSSLNIGVSYYSAWVWVKRFTCFIITVGFCSFYLCDVGPGHLCLWDMKTCKLSCFMVSGYLKVRVQGLSNFLQANFKYRGTFGRTSILWNLPTSTYKCFSLSVILLTLRSTFWTSTFVFSSYLTISVASLSTFLGSMPLLSFFMSNALRPSLILLVN